jgi:hypothetical protein
MQIIQGRIKRHQERFSSEMEEDTWIRKKYSIQPHEKMFNIAGGENSYQVRVCVYACMHACMHVCMYVRDCVCACMHVIEGVCVDI